MRSSDLENWETVFEGEVPSGATALEILDGKYFIGLDNGAIAALTE